MANRRNYLRMCQFSIVESRVTYFVIAQKPDLLPTHVLLLSRADTHRKSLQIKKRIIKNIVFPQRTDTAGGKGHHKTLNLI